MGGKFHKTKRLPTASYHKTLSDPPTPPNPSLDPNTVRTNSTMAYIQKKKSRQCQNNKVGHAVYFMKAYYLSNKLEGVSFTHNFREYWIYAVPGTGLSDGEPEADDCLTEPPENSPT